MAKNYINCGGQKNMKKTISFLLSLVLLISCLSACGNKQTDDSNAAEEKSESSKNSITLAIWDSVQEPGLREICDDFTAETGVKVDIQVTPWEQYWTMLEAGATGKSLPDVFWMHVREIERYAQGNMLLNLDDKIESSDKIDLNNYFEDVVGVYNYEGSQYAIPKDIDSIALWYNKAHFDEAGLEYPNKTWTWTDMKDAAEKLTTDDHYGFGSRILNYQEGWYNLVYGLGGSIISEDMTTSGYDNPKTVEAIEYFQSFVADGTSPDNTVTSENDLTALFESGTISMALHGSWTVSELTSNEYVQENAGVAMIPMTDDGTRVSIYNGLGYAAAANTAQPDEAWALIEYLGSEEAQKKQAELGVTLSAYKGTSDGWANTADGFDLSPYIDVMDDTLVFYPHSKNTTAWENMANEKLVKAWTGESSVADVCIEITEEMNKLLDEE